VKRTAIVALVVSAALLGVLAWQAVVRQGEYSRLVADGDRALSRDETFLAIESFSGAIALRRDSMLAYLKRGETYRRRGESGAALRDLRKAAELDPTATKPLELLGDLNASLERYARAQESYEAYLRLDDRSPRVLYKLALARYRLGHPQPAIPPLRQALVIDDRLAPAYYLLGLCLKALDQPAEAVAALEHAVALEPGLSAAREELAEAYSAAHRDKEAINQLETLAALEPKRPERRLALGLAYGRAGRSDLAVITLRRMAEDHPEDPEVFVAIGRVWLEAAEAQRDRVALNKAIEALEAVASRNPPGSEALLLLGRAKLLAGDLGAAERTLKQATAQFPIEPAALLQLASVAERAGHVGTARDALMRYTAISGDGIPPPERALHLGDLSMRLNEPAAAVGWYAKAAQSDSAPPSTFARLAESQFRVGDQAGALASVERGLQREPRNLTLLGLQRRLQAVAQNRRQ
jgi:tetratricopeptide (TPR) repeat protein